EDGFSLGAGRPQTPTVEQLGPALLAFALMRLYECDLVVIKLEQLRVNDPGDRVAIDRRGQLCDSAVSVVERTEQQPHETDEVVAVVAGHRAVDHRTSL